jgi:hypothetical protein
MWGASSRHLKRRLVVVNDFAAMIGLWASQAIAHREVPEPQAADKRTAAEAKAAISERTPRKKAACEVETIHA